MIINNNKFTSWLILNKKKKKKLNLNKEKKNYFLQYDMQLDKIFQLQYFSNVVHYNQILVQNVIHYH